MSSPKRAAKPVTKTAAKASAKNRRKAVAKTAVSKTAAAKTATKNAARRHAAAAQAGKSAVVVTNGASADAKQVAATLDRILADGNLDVISAEALQALIASACRLYRARREAGEEFAPVSKNSISATDVMVTASALLKATDLAVFELGMWQNWTGR
jgi:hypothetical protein